MVIIQTYIEIYSIIEFYCSSNYWNTFGLFCLKLQRLLKEWIPLNESKNENFAFIYIQT